MAKYVCQVCGHVYDEDEEGILWDQLPDNWICPVCQSEKSLFETEEEA